VAILPGHVAELNEIAPFGGVSDIRGEPRGRIEARDVDPESHLVLDLTRA
jgi:hypothetical protein